MSERMTKLGTAITENVIYNYGSGEFLSRLSDPFWFQAFGAVLGCKWETASMTPIVCGALRNSKASDSAGFFGARLGCPPAPGTAALLLLLMMPTVIWLSR